MLILQRRPGESLRIGDDIEISVMAIEGGRARLAITAPSDILVLRTELIQAKAVNQDSVLEQEIPSELLSILGEARSPEENAVSTGPIKPVVSPHHSKQGEKTEHSK